VKPQVASDIALLLNILDQAYNKPSWHGTNLRGSIRRVAPAQAAWRPGTGRHNIWEIVVHAAYWKYAAARRFTGGSRGSFPLKGSNWFSRPVEPGSSIEKAWRDDLGLLDDMHDTLRATVVALSAKDLSRTPPGKKVSNFALLSGIAAHDLYHAGQIQLLKRLIVL
jgi:DinB superfamily